MYYNHICLYKDSPLYYLIFRLFRASPTTLFILSSHVESSPHVESHFFNYTQQTLYFIFIFIKIIFLLFSFNFFFLSPPSCKLNIQNPTTTTTPLSCKQQTQAEIGRSPRWDRQAQAEIGRPRPRSASAGWDRQTQTRFQPPHHQAHFQLANPSSFPKSTENRGNLWRTEGRAQRRKKNGSERKKSGKMKEKKKKA